MEEATDLNPVQYEFESHRGYNKNKMKKKEPEHYWNIRVITHSYPESDERNFYLTEVHYDNGVPSGYSKGVHNYSAGSLKELNWRLNRMKEAIKKPILDGDNWPNEWSE